MAKEGVYKRIARSEISLSGFAPAYAWSLKRDIYGDLKERYGSGTVGSEFLAFYNAQTGTSVQKSWQTEKAINGISLSNGAAWNRMGQLDSLLEVSVVGSQTAINNFYSQPQSTQIQQLNNGSLAQIMPQAAQWRRERDSLWAVVKQLQIADIQSAATLNQTLTGTSNFEQLDKEINGIYLTQVSYVVPNFLKPPCA